MSETEWVVCDRCDQPGDLPPPLWWLGRHAHGTRRVAYTTHWFTLPAPTDEEAR